MSPRGGLRTLVLAPFFSAESAGNRPHFVAQVLAEFGPVDVVTTDFDHQRKARKRDELLPDVRRVVQLATPAYASNVSVRRFASHVVFALRAAAFARVHRAEYDVVYATAPLNLLASLAFRLLPRHRRVLDVVDVWPDVLPFPKAVRRAAAPLFAAWRWLFSDACRRADVVLAVSDRFLADARRARSRDTAERAGRVRRFFIGHPAFPAAPRDGPTGRRVRVAYVGNIGRLYDFETLLAALSAPGLRARAGLVVVGGGDREAWLREQAAARGVAAEFHGVEYDAERLAAILRRCDVGFNGYRNTEAAFSYKATTYLAAGLPLLNSMGGDLWALVGDRGLGANYDAGDAASLGDAIERVTAADGAALRARCAAFFEAEVEAGAVAAAMRAFLRDALGAESQATATSPHSSSAAPQL